MPNIHFRSKQTSVRMLHLIKVQFCKCNYKSKCEYVQKRMSRQIYTKLFTATSGELHKWNSLFFFTRPHFWQTIYYSRKKKTWSFNVEKCREEQNGTSSCSYRCLASARGDLARPSSLSRRDLSTRQHGSKKGGTHDVCAPKINSCSIAKAKFLLLMHLT